jgi:hypothetical protein
MLHIPMPDMTHRAVVSGMTFYDPDGVRLHV